MTPMKIAQARLWLIKKRPYLATALFALTPISKSGLGTLAVDKWWRLYYDPHTIENWGIEELATVLYHEILHLLRDHPNRLRNFPPRIANIGADLEINDDLKDEGFTKFPAEPLLPEGFNLPKHEVAEFYISELLRRAESDNSSPSQQKIPLTAGMIRENRGSNKQDSGVGNSNTGREIAPADSAQSADRESRTGKQGRSADAQETPMPGHGRCGSAATGTPEWWEEPPDSEYPAVSDTEAQVLRRAVAQAVIEHAQKNRGDVPAHMQRWAEEILTPKIDWRRELNSLIRRALGAKRSGAVDYTYSRPSRRRIPRVILPSLYQPTPNVAIVVDTSGSMTDSELAQALAEIKGVIRAVGHRAPVTVLTVDAEVHTVKKVFRANEVKLEGGGGTDMRIGIQEALKLRPRPDIILVITDGYTPWPERKPDGVEIIVALIGENQESPTWAKTVVIQKEGK